MSLRENFAGREGNSLDRLKAMKAAGWDLTVLTVKDADYVLVLGCISPQTKHNTPGLWLSQRGQTGDSGSSEAESPAAASGDAGLKSLTSGARKA